MINRDVLRWVIRNNKKYIPFVAILVVISILYSVSGVLFALASKNVIDAAIDQDPSFQTNILFLASVLAGILVFRALFQYLSVFLTGKVEINLKNKMYAQLLHKDYQAVTKYHSVDLMNRLNSDIGKIADGFVDVVPKLSFFAFRFMSAFLVLFLMDKWFALIMVGFGLFVLLGTQIFGKRMRRLHTEHQETESKSKAFMQETIENILAIKSFEVEDEMTKNNLDLLRVNFKKKIQRNNMSIFASSGVTSVMSVGYFIAIIWGALQIVAQAMTFGSLTAILQLVQQVQSPFSGVSQLLPKYFGMIASAERIIELEQLKDEPITVYEPMNEEEFSKIVFDRVSFWYDNEDVILKDLSLVIDSFDVIRLSGPSGIGKSTILKLMLGILEPSTGRIYIELKNKKKIPVSKTTRHFFSYVPQGNLILSGTIRDNIVFHKDDYTMNQVIAASKVAEIDEFIKSLPNKYDTILGERGMGLSEGQIQRLAIARAVMSDALVLLFDEATSALDAETESRILNNIKRLKHKTCVLVSHKEAANVVSEKIIDLNPIGKE